MCETKKDEKGLACISFSSSRFYEMMISDYLDAVAPRTDGTWVKGWIRGQKIVRSCIRK